MCVTYVGTKCKSLKVALSTSKRTNQRNILHYTKKTKQNPKSPMETTPKRPQSSLKGLKKKFYAKVSAFTH